MTKHHRHPGRNARCLHPCFTVDRHHHTAACQFLTDNNSLTAHTRSPAMPHKHNLQAVRRVAKKLY